MTSMEVDKEGEEPVVAPVVSSTNIEDVTMHPLVLLSAADHYHRVARGTRKRVVGVLLGMVSRGRVDCTNSFAVPFEEDSRNPVSTIQRDAEALISRRILCRHFTDNDLLCWFPSLSSSLRIQNRLYFIWITII